MLRLRSASLASVFLAPALLGAAVPTPEQFAGFPVGADRRLVRWEKIVEYMHLLARSSDRVRVETLGKTTQGNPFIAVIVSSPGNLARIDQFRDTARRLASGRVTEAEARRLAGEGRVFAFINHNIHSTEIASSQTTLEMIYGLATGDSPDTKEILDNVILVHVPSANPDGQILTVDWYNRNLGSKFERSPMPWLYHPYVGHDNNRDFFMGNMIETRYMQKLVYQEYTPQVYLDQHQAGVNSARMFVPPFPDPPNERVHPLIWQQTLFFGGAMASALESAGKKGVQAEGTNYRIYHEGGTLSAWWHNITAVLTEAAGASVATPVTLRPEDLQMPLTDGLVSNMKITKAYPDPWPGGTWRLRDAIDYQMIAARAFLKHSARYRTELLYNHYVMARDQIAKAESEGPYAYVISPASQRDPLTAADLVQRLINQGVEAHRASAPFQAGGKSYPPGSFVLFTAQATRPALVDLLEPQSYPEMRAYEGGPPIRPYDVTGYTLSMQMGVVVDRIPQRFDAPVEAISRAVLPAPAVDRAQVAYVLNHEINKTVVAVNRLLKAGVPVYRAREALDLRNGRLSPGAFLVPASAPGIQERLQTISKEIGIPVAADPPGLSPAVANWGMALTEPRIALYKSWVASMDEGWTRWILEQNEFPYTSLTNAMVKAGHLHDRFDVIILPAETTLPNLLNGYSADRMPAEYAGGIGDEGVANLKQFAMDGGTLVTLDSAGEAAIEKLGAPVKDTLKGVPEKEFYAPGSILALHIDTRHPIGYGLPELVAAKFVRSPAYELGSLEGRAATSPHVVASYPADRPLLMSGLLIGESRLQGRAAVVEMKYGRGRLVMLGFRVQHRGQTHGTFKLLFNSIYYGASK
ncbi:MAG TPA: M14 metallopeptidase family protein [Bryobacteraceae bacterium]|nr:M14 metallopeptidase family protein [Bryobacteraceae bacterium]